MSRTDRVIGITLGLIVGIAALILFIFGGSGESIDAPSLHPTTSTSQSVPAPR